MEANRLEICDFYTEFNGEKWHIDKAWVRSDNDQVAWYEGLKFRGSVAFRRIFSPDQVKVPEVERQNES